MWWMVYDYSTHHLVAAVQLILLLDELARHHSHLQSAWLPLWLQLQPRMLLSLPLLCSVLLLLWLQHHRALCNTLCSILLLLLQLLLLLLLLLAGHPHQMTKIDVTSNSSGHQRKWWLRCSSNVIKSGCQRLSKCLRGYHRC